VFRSLGAIARTVRHAVAEPRRLIRVALALLVLGAGVWFLSWRVFGWHHLSEAKRALQRDHFREALDHLQASLRIWPDDPQVLFLAARAARRVGNLELADQMLKLCEGSPTVAEDAPLERALLRATRGEVDEVGGYCQSLLEQGHPEAPLIREALAQGFSVTMRLPEASFYLDQWLEEAPEHPQALYQKGRLELQSANQQEAAGFLRRVVALDPERDDARLLLAGVLLELSQAQEALTHLETLARRLPGNPLVQVRLAQCLDLLGRQQESVELLDDVLRRQPHLAAALVGRGKLALRAGDFEKAERYLQEACVREPADVVAKYQLFLCLKQRGKANEAKAVLEERNRLEKDLARLHDIAAGEMSQRPRDPALHAEVGAILLRLGTPDQGVRWLEGALRLAPHNAAAHRALAQHYQSIGQFGRAERHRALAGDPPSSATK
jgi:tetratricopeptide (TPR) repeat protein